MVRTRSLTVGDASSPLSTLAFHHSFSRHAIATLAAIAFLAPPLSAQTVDTKLWGTDGDVVAVARVGNTIYVGGRFDNVGPVSGGCVPLNARTGEPVGRFPKVAGTVHVIVPDGRGGRYIGGEFIGVGGLARHDLAHILSDGTVDDWAPDPDADVRAIVVHGAVVYAAGAFTTIGGQTRQFIASVDASTGRATAWNPNADAAVWALIESGGLIYAGGEFRQIGGEQRSCLAALDPSSGAATAWNPGADWRVRVLIARGRTILVGGEFSRIGSQLRSCIAAVDATTGAATSWNPNATMPVFRGGYGPEPIVLAVEQRGNTVYVGGWFKGIGGQSRGGLAAVDANTGEATSWNPIPVADPTEVGGSSAAAFQLRGDMMYVAGYLNGIGGTAGRFLAAVSLKSGSVTDWDPEPNGGVDALCLDHGEVWVGGYFTGFRWQPHGGFAALDATTGAVTDWSPKMEGQALAFARTGDILYIAGHFQSIAGLPRMNLASLDLTTHAIQDMAITTDDAQVDAAAIVGRTLYLAGNFMMVDGQRRSHLAAVDRTTGALAPWDPNSYPYNLTYVVYALAASGNLVYAGGEFSTIGGQPRLGVAALDATTGLATNWNPSPDIGEMETLAVRESTVYVGGDFLSIGGESRCALAALSSSTGRATPWNPNPNGVIHAMALDGSQLYVGGQFTLIGRRPRSYLAAIDLETGEATKWDVAAGGIVRAVAVSDAIVYVGGRLITMGAFSVSNIAAIRAKVTEGTDFTAGAPPASNGGGVLLAQNVPNPVRSATLIRFSLRQRMPVSLEVFDLQGRRVETLLDHELQLPGERTVEIHTAGWRSGVYLYRLRAGGAQITRKMLVMQ